jgi:predicted NBD/HSP70 family sugar kinase
VHVPVWSDDVNAFAVAQKLFGAGRNHRHFAALAVGTGIGSSLVIDGEIYHGARSVAGKFGHITSVPGGRLCERGRHGCLMAHAAEPFMLETWWARSGAAMASRVDFAAAVEAGVPAAVSIVEEAGARIGHHLADLVNLFDPEVIVVGGEAVQFGEALIGPIRREMEKSVFFSKPELLPDWVPAPGRAAQRHWRCRAFSTSSARQADK